VLDLLFENSAASQAQLSGSHAPSALMPSCPFGVDAIVSLRR
jgi:hypothetical protein